MRMGGDGKHDGVEFRLVEVALIAVIEDNVPDEFVVSGDVMVCLLNSYVAGRSY